MRLPIFAVSFLCFALWCVLADAQIPENARFQPGSYAFGPYVPRYAPQPLPAAANEEETVAAEKNADTEKAGEDTATDWEKKFAPIFNAAKNGAARQPMPGTYPPALLTPSEPVPHLSFAYDKWSRRFNLIPYEPGYAMSPTEFPAGTSPMYVFVSSMSSQSVIQPPVRYMSYYDPDPVVLPASIRLRGSRFFQKDMQPMPMPVPKPVNAVPAGTPPRTQIGKAVQNTFGDFKLQ
ncbi:MAG: hypothetical protein LBT89_00365 [Planctomycetaceae bacterium]|jgi:hypothetical protein|nr:hypothetical protein [Planctomycetaceae bacterium]